MNPICPDCRSDYLEIVAIFHRIEKYGKVERFEKVRVYKCECYCEFYTIDGEGETHKLA